jgi:hypothetical protein
LPVGPARDWLTRMRGNKRFSEAIMFNWRRAARPTAYVIALLLSAVWLSSASASARQPLFDLGKAGIDDAIIAFAGLVALSPLKLAQLLVGLKLLLGSYLLTAVIVAVHDSLRWGSDGDEMLDLGLFVSAIASIVAAAPVLMQGEALCGAIGELMLCAIASGLLLLARGPLVSDDRRCGDAAARR